MTRLFAHAYGTEIPRAPKYSMRAMEEYFDKLGEYLSEILNDSDYKLGLRRHTIFTAALNQFALDKFNFKNSHIVYIAMRIGYYQALLEEYVDIDIPEWTKEMNP